MIEYEKFRVWCDNTDILYAVAEALDRMGYHWKTGRHFREVVSEINQPCELHIGYHGTKTISFQRERKWLQTYIEISPAEILGHLAADSDVSGVLSSFDELLEG